MTGTSGRLKRVADHIGNETFCMTYGDGVANVDIGRLIEFHKKEGTLATLTAVQPPGRFGAFKLSSNSTRISRFREKPKGDGAWVNGGFFVPEPRVLDYIPGDETYWEIEPLATLSENGELTAYRHEGFWYAMDTLRDRNILDEYWSSGKAPWKIW